MPTKERGMIQSVKGEKREWWVSKEYGPSTQQPTTREERQLFRFKKRGRKQDNKTTRKWLDLRREKKMASKHGVWSQYAATNHKKRKTTVLIWEYVSERKKARQQGTDSICGERQKRENGE
jgi:hypothetical protein